MILFRFDTVIPCVLLGFLLDRIIGDPRWLYHPVQMIGKLITAFERFYRFLFRCPYTEGTADEDRSAGHERAAGTCCAVTVILISVVVPWAVLRLLYCWNFWAGFALETFWCSQMLASRDLEKESMNVYREVRKGDLPAARKAVSMIVGRDTEALDLTGVTKAAVETVAENCSDGVIAPLFYMMIGGACGGFFYKAVNTMDSMIGYVNDRYQFFGTFAAKLDDVLNFLPARLAGIFMCLSAGIDRYDRKNAWKIFKRDRLKHASPNSAHTEAATAGALDIQLAGDAWYFGVLHKKDYLGDPIRPVEAEDIPRANRLMVTTCVVSLILFAAVRALIIVLANIM